MTIVLAIALIACVGLAALLLRQRSTRRRLEARLAEAAAQLEFLQQAFSRFAPASVVDRILTHQATPDPKKKEVTVLFADLRGFTAMSESLDPAVLVDILNGYFRAMSRAITERSGHVSKFIGDGILALFGALDPNPWQSDDAVHAALAMRAALEAYNRELLARELPQLAIGVGIHRGEVVAGVVGGAQLLEYTVIGSHVNLASRVESLTRDHGVDVLVTEAVRAHLDPRFVLRPLPARPVKGVSEPVATYAVEGFGDLSGSSPARGWGTAAR